MKEHEQINLVFSNTEAEKEIEKNEKKLSNLSKLIFIIILSIVVTVSLVLYCVDYVNRDYIDGNVLRLASDVSEQRDTYDLCNPWKNASLTASLMFQTVFETDASCSEINPKLAQSYEVSDDGLTYIITMEENLLWSDGEAITVEDVVFSIESFLLCDDVNGSIYTALTKIEGADIWMSGNSESLLGISYEENIITIQLSERYNNFAMMLTQFVVLPKHILGEEDVAQLTQLHWFFQNDNSVCSGMYKSEGVDEEGNIVLVKNEYYEGDTSDIETIILYWDWENTEIDYYSTSTISETVSFRSLTDYSEYAVDVSYYRYFVFNIEGSEVVEDVRIRQAINYAIDIEQLFSDYYYSTGSLVYAGSSDADQMYEYNPSKAIELLNEANYDYDYIFEIGYYHTDMTTYAFLESVCMYLNEVGMQTELIQLESSEIYIDSTYDMLFKALSSFNLENWYGEYLSSYTNLAALMGDEGYFDDLIDSFSSALTSEEAKEYEQQLTNLEQILLYKLPLFTCDNYIFINTSRVAVPEDLELGNIRYFSDLRFNEWAIIQE